MTSIRLFFSSFHDAAVRFFLGRRNRDLGRYIRDAQRVLIQRQHEREHAIDAEIAKTEKEVMKLCKKLGIE